LLNLQIDDVIREVGQLHLSLIQRDREIERLQALSASQAQSLAALQSEVAQLKLEKGIETP
jgi:hypothetical protein